MKNKILWDLTWIIRSNRNLLFWMNRKDTLRLGSIVSRLSLLEINDEKFNDILDKLTNKTLLTSQEHSDLIIVIDAIPDESFDFIWEKKELIINFLYSIKNQLTDYNNWIDSIITTKVSVKDNVDRALWDAGF